MPTPVVDAFPASQHGASAQPRTLWRLRPFRLLLTARACSALGDGLSRVGLVFTVLGLPGGTAADLAVVMVCLALPQLLLAPLGGVLADRLPRGRIMVVADLLGATTHAVLAVAVLSGTTSIPVLAVLAAATSVSTSLFGPASRAAVPELISTVHLQSAYAVLRTSTAVAMLIGLSCSSAVVVLVGPGVAFAVDALSYVVSALCIAAARVPSHRVRGDSRPWADLREGARLVAQRRWVWRTSLHIGTCFATFGAVTTILGPVAVSDGLGGVWAWSVIIAAPSVGALLGCTVGYRIRPVKPLVWAIGCAAVYPIPMVSLALGAPVPVSASAMFLVGLGTSLSLILWDTALNQHIPAELRGRVASIDDLTHLTLTPVALQVAGPLATAYGHRPVLLGCALIIATSAALALLSPHVRNLSSLAATPPSTDTMLCPDTASDHPHAVSAPHQGNPRPANDVEAENVGK
ncbi:MFS transporter [Allokutzneria sp. NRRL B-24872]|uniref:MFS transporter n=1 Tax=Allokutzneria sp. NRRL B-24872 TaxID=1137961 RepID=UPI000A39F483|nr:MFS transporter [Allokutzneria sp. NRRL B-24872]